MVGFLHAAPVFDVNPGLSTELPHSVVVEQKAGVCLLVQPRTTSPQLSLGCAWSVVPRNLEVLDEAACLEMAALHEHLIRMLPIGTSLQAITTIVPATSMPAWEQARASHQDHPVVQAQQAAIRQGLVHQDGAAVGRLRTIRTLVTLRVPMTDLAPAVGTKVQEVLDLPARAGASLARTLVEDQALTLERLAGMRQSLADTLRTAGHQVTALTGEQLGQQVALGLDPTRAPLPVIQPDLPLAGQVVHEQAQNSAGGYRFGWLDADGRTFYERWQAQVLSLRTSPPKTYPGMLTAPRAPQGGKPLALWQVWDGPLSIVRNIAVVDRMKEKGHQQRKRFLANIHNQKSVENQTLVKKLDTLLEDFMLAGADVQWQRVHVVLWGQEAALRHGVSRVIEQGQRLKLQFTPEPSLGSTLFLQTVPLGFDQDWPPEWAIRRACRMELKTLGQFFLGGGFEGTATPGIAYLNQCGEGITYHPRDSKTNAHRITLGTSGAGKTHAVAYETNQLMPLGETIVIVDPLRRYRNLLATWKGMLHSVGFDHPPCFNLFFGDMSARHVSFQGSFVAQLAGGGGQPLSWDEFSVLSGALTYNAATWDTTRGEPWLTAFVEEVLQDGCFDKKDPEARKIGLQIARKLKLFCGTGPTRGAYADFVDGPNTFHIDPGLTVVELYELEKYEDLKGILFFAMVHLITQHFADPSRFYTPKSIKFDEAWSVTEYQRTAQEVHRIFRTARNYGVSAEFLSHTGDDFDTPIGKVIRALAGSVLFLKQEAGEIAKLKTLFHLSDVEEERVRQAQKYDTWSSGYLRIGEKEGGMVRLVSDRFTTLQMSQDPTIAQWRDRAVAAAGGDMYQALLAMLAEEVSHGAA